MIRRISRRLAVLAAVWLGLVAGGSAGAQPPSPNRRRYEPTAEERQRIGDQVDRLARAIAELPRDTPRDLLADVAVFHRAGASILKLGEFYEPKDVATTLFVLERGQ